MASVGYGSIRYMLRPEAGVTPPETARDFDPADFDPRDFG